MNKSRTIALSSSTASRVDWYKIADAISAEGLARDRSVETSSPAANALPADYPDRVERVFKQMKTEFEVALTPLRKQLNVTLWVMLPALGVSTVAGAVMIGTNMQIAGGVVTAASVGALFALIVRSWHLGKDQAILELIPQSYETLFALCSSPDQFQVVFDALLEETLALRRHLRNGGPPTQ